MRIFFYDLLSTIIILRIDESWGVFVAIPQDSSNIGIIILEEESLWQ
jgi:hypothetical protein